MCQGHTKAQADRKAWLHMLSDLRDEYLFTWERPMIAQVYASGCMHSVGTVNICVWCHDSHEFSPSHWQQLKSTPYRCVVLIGILVVQGKLKPLRTAVVVLYNWA